MQVNWVVTQTGEARQDPDTRTEAWGLGWRQFQLSVLGHRTEPDQCQAQLDAGSQKAGLQGPLPPPWDPDETSSAWRGWAHGSSAQDLCRAEGQTEGLWRACSGSSPFSRRIMDPKYDLSSLNMKPQDTHSVYWNRMEKLFLTTVSHCNFQALFDRVS